MTTRQSYNKTKTVEREDCFQTCSSPLKLDSEQSLSLQNGHMKTPPFLLNINGVITRRNLNLTSVNRTLWDICRTSY